MIKEAASQLINSMKALADYGLIVWQETWAKDKEDDHHRLEETRTGLRYCPFCKKYGIDLEVHMIDDHPDLVWGKKE